MPPHVLKLNIESGAIILSLDGHSDTVFSLFLMDSFLFSGSSDSTIVCWNTENGEMIRHYDGHSGIVVSVAVFDGELYSAALRTEILKWNINTGQVTRKFAVVHGNNMIKKHLILASFKHIFRSSYCMILYSSTARPKSITLSFPSSANNTFSGFRSR